MLTQTLLAVLAPLAAWLLISGATFVRRSSPGEGVHRFAAGVALSAITLSWFLSFGLLRAALGGETVAGSWAWLSVGSVTFDATLGVDRLTAVMLSVVSTVSLLVQVYSLGYLHGDSHFPRFYAVVSLFTFAMLLLVVARDYLLLLLAWELMGVCSHLLIGHYFTTEAAQRASVKAFLTTRLGDVGLFLALMVLFAATGTLTFAGVEARLPGLAPGTVTLAALGLFAAAAGKSAQVPLHVWLPDAMAGPTPVSALI
ncbi:MAG TPA: NADH-quinone oxidoreductase subunit L, partial [Firmicutes bacterium]|nr:NADH-quinone oxidoreductase subunit L [Bacillota bacterium]